MDSDWQMSGLFLLALALLGFVMRLIALLLPSTVSTVSTVRVDRPHVFWLLPSPTSLKRLRPVPGVRSLLMRAAFFLGAVALGYGIYWQLVRVFHLRGVTLSYCAAPILWLVSEFLVTIVSMLWLPSGRLLPTLHNRPILARSVADFWGNRWNLWFRDWFRHAIFRRLPERPVLALFLVFAVSGLMHEWVINVPLYHATGRLLFGSMMVYFLLQAAGVLVERRFLKGRVACRAGFAWLVVVGPVPLVINEGLLRTLHLWPELG